MTEDNKRSKLVRMTHDHSHSHTHSHSHGHSHHGSQNLARLGWVLVLTLIYMVVEFTGGLWANSLALMADAGHMLTDAGTLGLALFAAWFSNHPASAQKTYGYYRLEIFAAFMNGLLLVLISLYIFWQASQRFFHPTQVNAETLTLVAAGGLVINLFSGFLLFEASRDNINMRAAFLHIASDALGSLGAIIAGVLIFVFHWYQADPLFSVIIAVLVLFNAWGVMQEALNILLEAAPQHLSVEDIETALKNLPEVQAVHDLHVWSITSGKEALSAHIVVTDPIHYSPVLLNQIQCILKDQFNLSHVTLQLEPPDFEEITFHC